MVLTSALTDEPRLHLLCLVWSEDRPCCKGSSAQSIVRCGIMGFYVSLALAVLAKGPVGAVLAASSIGLFVLTTRRWDLLKILLRPGAVLSGLAVALPWYWLCYRANGWTFIQEFLINHNLARFATDRYQHPQPFWFYHSGRLCRFSSVGVPDYSAGVALAAAPRGEEVQRGLELALFWAWALIPLLSFFVLAIQAAGLRAADVSCAGTAGRETMGQTLEVGSSNEGALTRTAPEPLSAGLCRIGSWLGVAFR